VVVGKPVVDVWPVVVMIWVAVVVGEKVVVSGFGSFNFLNNQ
jgi:hypothetical protein